MEEYSNPNQGNKAVGVIIIIVVVLALLAGGWYWFIYKPEQDAKEKARLEQVAREEAERKAQELEVQNRIKYDTLINQGDVYFEQEEWASAQSAYSDASALFPNEQYPKDQLTLVKAKLDEMARRAAGFVEKVPSPTNRYYVIVSSSIDDDLAMDYANKLAKEGEQVKIIEHHANELPFFGVSLGDYATWDEAMNATTSFSSYDGAWVLKY